MKFCYVVKQVNKAYIEIVMSNPISSSFIDEKSSGGYSMDRTAAIEALNDVNEEFKRMREKHKAYEKELDEFKQRRYLTSEEEIAVKQIKKNKLALKDKMEKLINEFLKNN